MRIRKAGSTAPRRSILHALVDTLVMTNAEAINVVAAATDVKREVATAAGESTDRVQQSLDLLSRMTASFEADGAGSRPATEPHFPRLASLGIFFSGHRNELIAIK